MKIKQPNLALISLITNLIYAFYNAIIGFWEYSWWFVTLSAYYVILSVMRFAVLIYKQDNTGFIKRFIGVLFIITSVILAGTAYLSIQNERGNKYNEIVMITIALYSFVKITIAIINLANARKTDSEKIITLRNISFADALVSIFALQRSMLTTFEGVSQQDILLFNALTGTAIYFLVFILGINLIGGKKFIMAKSKLVNANQKIAKAVTEGYKKIEKGVVDGYKGIEKGVVEGYTKIEDRFVDQFLTRDGETVEQAKQRLKDNK